MELGIKETTDTRDIQRGREMSAAAAPLQPLNASQLTAA